MKSLIAALLMTGLLLSACNSEEKPPGLIEEDTYINLLVELQLLKSHRQYAAVDSAEVDSLQALIYRKYGISEEQFRISHRHYQGDPEKQKERVEAAIERLRMDKVESDTTRPWLQQTQPQE